MEKVALTVEQSQVLIREVLRARKVRYVVHTDDHKHAIGLALYSEDPEAAKLLQVLAELVVTVDVGLLSLFGLDGERF